MTVVKALKRCESMLERLSFKDDLSGYKAVTYFDCANFLIFVLYIYQPRSEQNLNYAKNSNIVLTAFLHL
jgi:hypothetical protein